MSNVIIGLYKSPSDAADAVRLLTERGVPIAHISLLARQNADANPPTPIAATVATEKDSVEDEPHSKAGKGFAVGALGGGAFGAVLAGLTAAGTIATGGAGLGLVVAGPLLSTLIGAGAGATAGSVVGGMVGAASPENEVRYYEGAIDAGSVLIAVTAADDGERQLAHQTMLTSGAEGISRAA